MKKLILSTTTILTFSFCFSQDIITKKSGEDIQAKVIEVTTSEIKYKKFDNQTGPILTISTMELLMIRYENGSKDIFTTPQNPVGQIQIVGTDSAYFSKKGREDAIVNYHGQNCGAIWVVPATISAFTIPGIIVASICSNHVPKDHNLNYPDSTLINNRLYSEAYKKQAHKIKTKKLWKYYITTLKALVIPAGVITYIFSKSE
jgi:hypothetical protein